ncbi:MAG: DUF928 domain-containing protein [Leptolyngbya sp. SIO1D8]|nr:DUF928 domain-containing protein [Leptolyngbya sp. SIO1D8]
MKGFRHVQRSILVRVAGILLGGSSILGSLPAIAQAPLRLNLPDLTAPGNRESGATRSTTCIDPDQKLIALVPESNYGQTQNDYPSFYFYLPPTSAQYVKFRIDNATTNETFYEGQFSLTGDSGIFGITLPSDGVQQPLEVGQSYYWYLTIVCEEVAADRTGDVTIDSMVERVAPVVDSAQSLASDLPGLYAEVGLWYDALDASATLKRADDAAAWNTLLTAVELELLLPVPVLSGDSTARESSASVISESN